MNVFFTVSEANKILPEVIQKFKLILSKKEEISKIEHEIQTSMMMSESMEGTSGKGTLDRYVPLKQRLNSAITEFYASIESLEGMGVLIKSIDEGLLDFPSIKFKQEVWLCWKYGETEVKFWHEKDSGFMGRKPLEVSDDELV